MKESLSSDVTMPSRRLPPESIVTLCPMLAFRPVAMMELEPMPIIVPMRGEGYGANPLAQRLQRHQ
ncbi:hypothetical protein NNO_0083 [Hydrogenimonas sp.]|nr:hypothetical protein NNO_0083 [Hydrogenimonas sp.]